MQIQDNYTDPYGNYASATPSPRYANDLFARNMEQTVPMFACYGGRKSRRRPELLYSIGVLCDILEMATIDAEPIDEKESIAMGKLKYKSNRGQMHKTSFKVNADAIYGLAAILDYDFSAVEDVNYSNLAPSVINIKGDWGVLGCIFLHSTASSRHLRTSEVLTQCRLNVSQTAGSTDSFTVNVESEGEHFESGNGQMFVFENFVDDGVNILNGNAPDGVRTVFKVGDGNQSLLGATTGVGTGLPLQIIRPHRANNPVFTAVTDPFFWFVEICVNGIPQQGEEVTSFNHATGKLTFAVAPPDGSCISLVYCLPTGYPDFSEKQAYFINDMVKYGTDYYKCTTNHLGTWNIADFVLVPNTTLYMGAQYRPHNFGQSTDNLMNPTYPTCMFNTWHIFNYRM